MAQASYAVGDLVAIKRVKETIETMEREGRLNEGQKNILRNLEGRVVYNVCDDNRVVTIRGRLYYLTMYARILESSPYRVVYNI